MTVGTIQAITDALEVEVLCDTGEKTWEPLNTMKADEPITIAKYVKDKGLVKKQYWTWANNYIKNPKKFLRLCRQEFLAHKRTVPVYIFGV